MTIPLSLVDPAEVRLSTETPASRKSEHSFEDQLKFAEARIGLLFNPFAQAERLFSSLQNTSFSSLRGIETETENIQTQDTKTNQIFNEKNFHAEQNIPIKIPAPAVFDSFPTQNFNQRALQEMLAKTNWLLPNLEAQPFFSRALSENKFMPSFDLQSLVDQIAEQLKIVKEKGSTQLSLLLKPPELGKILLTLTYHAGMISIEITATPETRKLIDTHTKELEQALAKAQIHFDSIVIKEAEHV